MAILSPKKFRFELRDLDLVKKYGTFLIFRNNNIKSILRFFTTVPTWVRAGSPQRLPIYLLGLVVTILPFNI